MQPLYEALLLKSPLSLRRAKIVLSTLFLFNTLFVNAAQESQTVPLFDHLGNHHYLITTSVPAAQRYFDQGMILAYGFNHAEAARSFRQAYRLDPKCALCYWGEALVLGPNINAPMDPAVVPIAYDAVQKSIERANSVTEKEKALTQALSSRYTKEAPEDRSQLDEAYAESMRKVAQRYPDDAVIASLFAESLMDLHPWDFWTIEGKPRPWTLEIMSVLERALEIDPNQPLANHLYIHTMEASPFAEKAIPSAERLPTLVPGSGHLVHMPAHIYIRVGRYRDAILANQQAVKVDRDYLNHSHEKSIYTLAYIPHNHHFLWAAAIKTGQKKLAKEAADETAALVDKKLMREPGYSATLQHFYMIPLYTRTLFGEWDNVLKEPSPAKDLVYPTGIWHFTRGLALLRRGKVDQANREHTLLNKTILNPAISDLKIFDLNPVKQILQIAAEILSGEIEANNKNVDQAVFHLNKAIELEDGLHYNEPKDWYLPPRQVLGAILMKAGKYAEAEQVYRKDLEKHPQNGWSLFGLTQSLKMQQKNSEAQKVRKQFNLIWADGDVELTSSRF